MKLLFIHLTFLILFFPQMNSAAAEGSAPVESPAVLPVKSSTDYIHSQAAIDPSPVMTPFLSRFKNPHYAFTAGIEVPQPLTLGVLVNWDSMPKVKVFFEGGYFKYSLSSGRDISEFGFMTGIHYHPNQNWFFVGGSLGYRHIGFIANISSLKSDTGQVIASNATLGLNALFLALFMGGEWEWSQHLSLSVDLGAQFAMLHGGEINILPSPGSPAYDLSVSYQQTTDRLSGFPLPQLALLRFIYKLY